MPANAGGILGRQPDHPAAAPLLILLGRLRLYIVDMQAVPLMNHVAQEIPEFEKKSGRRASSRKTRWSRNTRLCGTADDIVQNLPGTDRHVWMQYSMLAQFFQVRTSGVGFFEELKKILANPAPRYNLLELMHACLSLGFEGQYRGAAGGDSELQRAGATSTRRCATSRRAPMTTFRRAGRAWRWHAGSGAQVPLWVIAGGAGAAAGRRVLPAALHHQRRRRRAGRRLIALHPAARIASRGPVQAYEPPTD